MNVIIPAKGFSSRVKRKNMRKICGLPLIAWSVIQAKAAKQVDKVYVSTNDDEIADTAAEFGALVLWRKYKETPDDSGAVPVYHAMEEIPKEDAVMMLLCTSPLRYPGMIDEMISLYNRTEGMNYLITLGSTKETVIKKRLDEIRFESVLVDKDFNYLVDDNSTTITDMDEHMREYEWRERGTGNMDTDIDAAASKGDPGFKDKRVPCYFPVAPWLCFETDSEEELRVTEILLEGMILRGRSWRDTYEK